MVFVQDLYLKLENCSEEEMIAVIAANHFEPSRKESQFCAKMEEIEFLQSKKFGDAFVWLVPDA